MFDEIFIGVVISNPLFEDWVELSDVSVHMKLDVILIRGVDKDWFASVHDGSEFVAEGTDDVVGFDVVDMNDLIWEVGSELFTNGVHDIEEMLPVEFRFVTGLLAVRLVVREDPFPPGVLTISADDNLAELLVVLLTYRADDIEEHMTNHAFLNGYILVLSDRRE